MKAQKRAQLPAPQYPISFEAERAVLAAMMTKADSLPEILAALTTDDFVTQDHQEIFRICGELFVKQQPVDMVTVSMELRKRHQKELNVRQIFVPGNEFTGNYATYVRNLRDFTKRRVVLAKLDEARAQVGGAEDCQEVVSKLVGELMQAGDTRVNQPLSLEKVTILATKRIQSAMEKPGGVGIATGFRDFDKLIGGLQKPDVIVLGARPSIGKTAWLTQVLTNAAKRGTRGLLVSAEMTTEDIGTRMLSSESGVENFNLRKGNVDDSEIFAITGAGRRLNGLPLHVLPERRWEVIKTQIIALKRSLSDLAIVGIDYIQRLNIGYADGEQRYQALGRVSKEAKDLATDLDCVFIILAQIDRAIEKEKRAPRMSDLRESGDIEADADMVMFLHRYDPKKREKIYLITDKNRHGPVGAQPLRYAESEVKFYDWEEYAANYGDRN